MVKVTKKLCMVGNGLKLHKDFKRLVAFHPLVESEAVNLKLMRVENTNGSDEVIGVWELTGVESDVDEVLKKANAEASA